MYHVQSDVIPTKLVAVSPFWIDETEVTNWQYRQLVYPDYSHRTINIDLVTLKRKVVRGSWIDTSEGIRADTKSFEQQDKAYSYVGFRCVCSWRVDIRRSVELKKTKNKLNTI